MLTWVGIEEESQEDHESGQTKKSKRKTRKTKNQKISTKATLKETMIALPQVPTEYNPELF